MRIIVTNAYPARVNTSAPVVINAVTVSVKNAATMGTAILVINVVTMSVNQENAATMMTVELGKYVSTVSAAVRLVKAAIRISNVVVAIVIL